MKREHETEKLLINMIKDKSTNLFGIKKSNLEQYKKQSGVWAMWAKDTSNIEICLEVGQTMDVFNELKYDLSYLEKDYSKEDLSIRYLSRRLFEFSKRFDVCECDLNRTCAKYRDIAKNYFEVSIYLICDSKITKEERERIELEYAVDNKALYWNAWGKQRKYAKNYYAK